MGKMNLRQFCATPFDGTGNLGMFSVAIDAVCSQALFLYMCPTIIIVQKYYARQE